MTTANTARKPALLAGLVLAAVLFGGLVARSGAGRWWPAGGLRSWMGSEDAARRSCAENLLRLRQALEMKAVDHGSFPQPFVLQEAPGDATVWSGTFYGVQPGDLLAETYLSEESSTRCPTGGTYAAFCHPRGPISTCTHHGLSRSRDPLAPFTPRAGGLDTGERAVWIGATTVLLEEGGDLYAFKEGLVAHIEGPEEPGDRLVVSVEPVEGERSLVFRYHPPRFNEPRVDAVPLASFPAPDAVEEVLRRHLTKLAR